MSPGILRASGVKKLLFEPPSHICASNFEANPLISSCVGGGILKSSGPCQERLLMARLT